MTHLRYADAPPEVQDKVFKDLIWSSPLICRSLLIARDIDLPQWWIVSGALYNTVWNALTGRPDGYGIKDIDLFYWDDDTSWAAEDKIARQVAVDFAQSPPVEVRNQARVPLWYEGHFGHPYPAITRCTDAIDLFACTTHCVAMCLHHDDSLTLYAPFGLEDVFSFVLRPNPVLPNAATHAEKSARQAALWPELTVLPWPDQTPDPE